MQVFGARPELRKLRQAVVEAEDRFYDRYNALNDRNEFDVYCRVEVRTGTRLATRACRPVYRERAIQEASKQGIEVRQKFESNGGYNQGLTPPAPAGIAIAARQPEFERRMKALVRDNPELLALLKERAAAAEALAAATRRATE